MPSKAAKRKARRGPHGRLVRLPSPTLSTTETNPKIREDLTSIQHYETLNIAIREAGTVNASDATIANTHPGMESAIPIIHHSEKPNTLNNYQAKETNALDVNQKLKTTSPNTHQSETITEANGDQVQETTNQNMDQSEENDATVITEGSEAPHSEVQQMRNNTAATNRQVKETDTLSTHESDVVANHVVHITTELVGNEELETPKVTEKDSKKRKPVTESSASTSISKRARSASSEPTHRRQYESPFQIPLTTTERMRNIEKHEIKRNLNYMPNRTSAVLKPDGTQNNISVEAHLVQERGEVFASRCNSCGNKGRPAGPWEECVALEGFLQGSCANCHVNNLGKRCSLRPQKAHFLLAPSKNARIASKSTSKKRTGGSEEILIEQLMAMDSDGRDEFEDRANDVLNALRKARSRLRKMNKKKTEEICDSGDENADKVVKTPGLTPDLILDPILDPRLYDT